jgi:hypothetical protein
MRRVAGLTTLALAVSTLALAAPASAMPEPDAPGTTDRARLVCITGVVGVDAKRRVRYDTVRNGKVVDATRSNDRLGFRVTGWGLYESVSSDQARQLVLNSVTTRGIPQQVRITLSRKGRITNLGSRKIRNRSFEPKLFADGYGYYAYVVERGKLLRYSLFRYPDGHFEYGGKLKIDAGFGDLTSLQVTTYTQIKGVTKEVLYATTEAGELLQLQVPVKKPGRLKVRTLATTGYAGVTEMSWTLCNGDRDHIGLVAIDPAAGTATWTTVKDPYGRPRTTFRGEITGGADWNLSAVY